MQITAKDVKEIIYMPLVTFFSVLERPGKNRNWGCNNPPLVRRGLKYYDIVFTMLSYEDRSVARRCKIMVMTMVKIDDNDQDGNGDVE